MQLPIASSRAPSEGGRRGASRRASSAILTADRRPGVSVLALPGFLLLLVLATASPPPVAAQPAAEPPGEAAEPTAPTSAAPVQIDVQARARELGDTVPAGAMLGFIEAGRAGDWETAARHLDLDAIPPAERAGAGPRLARRLKSVLDRTLWIEFDRLSLDPEGDGTDGLAPNRDRVGTIDTAARGEVEVLLERIPRDGEVVWRIAGSTVALIPALYDEFGYGPLIELLPDPFFELHFLEIQLWQWLGLAGLVVVVYLLAWVATLLVQRAVRPLVARTETRVDDELIGALGAPLLFTFSLLFFAAALPLLLLAEPVEAFVGRLLKGLGVVALSWAALRLVDVLTAVLGRRLERQDKRAVASIIPLGRRAAKGFLLAIAVVVLLQNVGVNVTGLVAGLGVGGIAIALAAQKTIENVFGGVSVISDQPVRVGDFCRFGDGKVGTVEEIGLRSTRIRTLDRTLVTIPNADFAQRELESFTARDRMRLHAILGLRYETTPDQLRHTLSGLRRILQTHPRVSPDPARVRFVGFGAYSLDLEVFAYLLTADHGEFLQLREEIYLQMMDVIEEAGTSFAFPSQTLYLGRDSGLDQEVVRRAEELGRAERERAAQAASGAESTSPRSGPDASAPRA
ncbi:MAG TPA: mechanosensitive ion channel family protein [Thermoanaerobaculia bacterium]|nr:mechanosensitive ion channel family protein [Thermoanaerobaculia bacterium]